jgi:hypothetical protein
MMVNDSFRKDPGLTLPAGPFHFLPLWETRTYHGKFVQTVGTWLWLPYFMQIGLPKCSGNRMNALK